MEEKMMQGKYEQMGKEGRKEETKEGKNRKVKEKERG